MAERDDLMSEMLNADTPNVETDTEVVSPITSNKAPSEDDIINELSGVEGDLTLEHLRKLPGADKHSDEELEQMWQQAIAPKPQRSYKFLKDNNPVEDISELSADELLQLAVEYQAMGKTQVKTFDEIVRNAQLGHYNESRMQQILSERNNAAEQLRKLQEEITGYKNDRQTWDYVLNQYLQGNQQPLTKLLETVQQQQAQLPQFEQPQQQSDYEAEARGQQVYYEVILPNAFQLASAYGADATEVTNAIMQIINNEPAEYLTQQRFQAILQFEIPALLEQNGYSRNTPQSEPKQNDEIAELKKQLAELQAAQRNQTVNGARQKKAPPAGGGTTPSAGAEMDAINNRNDMKRFLRS